MDRISTVGEALHVMNVFIGCLDPRITKQMRRMRRRLVKKWLKDDSTSRWWVAKQMR